MTCTTFLHDGDLNQPIKNPVVRAALAEMRETTGEDWQVIEIELHRKRGWLQKEQPPSYLYEVYRYVGGCGPWQGINFYRESTEWSINLRANADVVVAYMYGIIGGHHLGGLKNAD